MPATWGEGFRHQWEAPFLDSVNERGLRLGGRPLHGLRPRLRRCRCAMKLPPSSNASRSLASLTVKSEDGKDASSTVGDQLTPARRRELGAFFTPPALADSLLELMSPSFTDRAVFLDPTCGAGDLLAAVARRLHGGVRSGSVALAGFDIEPSFVATARNRLEALAPSRDSNGSRVSSVDIREGDFLNVSQLEGVTHILMNPPFGYVDSRGEYEWASGRVSSAAVFLAAAVELAPSGTSIAAILPEVLRSGSRYRAFRHWLEARLVLDAVVPRERFSAEADVDVFLLHGVRRDEGGRCDGHCADWSLFAVEGQTGLRLGDKVRVSVGPVVPHRDTNRGAWTRYLDVRSAASRVTIAAEDLRRRRWSGRIATPPFIALRRTSSPSDRDRAIPTFIEGSEEVAVENHLLVVESDNIETLQRAFDSLMDPRTTAWLNRTIRLRHLTVRSIREIPWWVDDD